MGRDDVKKPALTVTVSLVESDYGAAETIATSTVTVPEEVAKDEALVRELGSRIVKFAAGDVAGYLTSRRQASEVPAAVEALVERLRKGDVIPLPGGLAVGLGDEKPEPARPDPVGVGDGRRPD